MESLYIPPSNETPEIDFRFKENLLFVRGESYPENAVAFFSPVRATLENYLLEASRLEANFELRYFNSSSTKLIRSFFILMHESASAGKHIVANWYHDPEDDMMMEFGMDLKEEFGLMDIRVLAVEMNAA